MSNTTVTIKYSNGATYGFIASDDLEKLINVGEMFSVTTLHPDFGEVMKLSKMYVGNPIAAMDHIIMMKRNAEKILQKIGSDQSMLAIIDTLAACIKLLSDEITSHQSGMSVVDDENEGRLDCPATNKHCDYYGYQCDSNGEVAIEHCSHPDNSKDEEGNCTSLQCPLCTEGGG